ncbi:MAG: Hsp33 family molecular chaperone HslO [Pseudomonadota bacterium]
MSSVLTPANSNLLPFDDLVLPFQIEKTDVAGRFLRTQSVITEILECHNYPDMISKLLGEALMVISLIGSGMKLRHRIILQLQGDGAVPMIVAEYTAQNTMRGYAKVNQEMFERWTGGEEINPFLLLGKGHVAITIDNGPGTTPYQGIVPLEGESLSAMLLSYIEQSEQIMSSLKIYLDRVVLDEGRKVWRGGALLIQKLGKSGNDMKIEPIDSDDAEKWDRTIALFNTASQGEVLDPALKCEDLLYRLFHEDGVRVFDPHHIRFDCSCSRERLKTFLVNSDQSDLDHMADENNKIYADCQFCRTKYEFDLSEIIDEQKQ